MANDVGLFLLLVHPAVPHHLMCVESVLRNAHGIGDTTRAIVRFAAMMGVRVGEDNLHAAAADTCSRSGTFQPVVIPAPYHLHGEVVHVVIIVGCRFAAVERTVAFLVERVAVVVPVLAQSFVAAVLHGPHGVFFRLVDVEHFSAVLCLIDVEHLARADGTAAEGVVLVAYLLHLHHVFARDTLVAALVEHDAGIVAVVDDGVAHQFRALCPSRVARFNVLFPRRDMHPAHQIAVRLHHQAVREVAQPRRNAQSDARPLVAGALCVAVHHQATVVDPHLSFGEARLAEARTDDNLVRMGFDWFRVSLSRSQERRDGIEITIAPRPKVQSFKFSLNADGACFTRFQRDRLARNDGRYIVIGIRHACEEPERVCFVIFVPHLRLHVYRCLSVGNVEVGGIDVGARRAQVRVER